MQRLKDYIYYNRKEIIIVIILIILIFLYFLISRDGDSVGEEIIEFEEKEEVLIEQVKQLIVVDIKGEVNNPGVYEFDEEKRVSDVILLAGGLKDTADTSLINLSEKIYDEMVIVIPKKGMDYEESKSNNSQVINK